MTSSGRCDGNRRIPNDLWQADHTELGVIILDESGGPARPWLTVITTQLLPTLPGHIPAGTEGVVRITNERAFQNKDDNTLEGVNGDASTFTPLPISDQYETLAKSDLDVSSQDTAYLYSAYARERATGSREASDVHHAVRLHQMIDLVSASSSAFFSRQDTPK